MVDWANLIYFFTLLAVEKPPSVMKFFVDQIDTIYILEKRDKVGSPQVSPGLSEEVQKRISSYVSQKTQGFNVLDNHYQVSEFKFHRGKGEGPFLNDDHLNATRLRAGVDKLGDGPNFENETPLLVYAVIDCRLLSEKGQKWNEMHGAIIGDCLFEVNDRRYVFNNVRLPMTHNLYGLDFKKNIPFMRARHPEFTFLLGAKFIKPFCFRQKISQRIVLPGMDVADVVSLGITLSNPGSSRLHRKHRQKRYMIVKVTVELMELTWAPSWKADNVSLTNVSQHLRTQKLLDVIVQEEICFNARKSNCNIRSIPRKLYSCLLPSVGPTFFSNSLSRSYALMITIRCREANGLATFTCSSFMEITVAKKDTSFTPGLSIQNISSPTISRPRRTLITIEKFLRPNFSPHDVGKSCFNEAWTKNAVLRSYLTMCYTSVEEIIAVTKVDVFDFLHRELNLLYQETKTFCVTPLGGGPQNIGTEIMIYEVLPKEKFNNSDGNESKRRYGGLFLRLNDRREEVPPSFSFFEEKDVYDESIFKATKLFPVGFPLVWHLGLQCIFVKHECFRQSTGANVVLPRMKISEFLDIRFFYPMSFHDARRRCDVEGDHEITIDLVRIGLCEIVGTHVPGEEGTTVFNWMIRDKVYHKQVLWSQFHGTIPNDPTTVTMSLPKDIINANLLNVGPTFYLKQLHRRYRMTIELSVKVRMGARKVERCMQVSLPINVAHEEDISH